MIMNNFFDNLEKISNNKNLLFDGALYVRNNFSTSVFHSIGDWNEYSLWKKFFPEDKLKEVYFFADNILSYQYGIYDEKVVMLNPEDSSLEIVASSLDEWFSVIKSDKVTYLYSDILEEWESRNGKILLGEKLIPSIPFIIGGDYELDIFIKCTELEAMRYYSQYAKTLYKLPDGNVVKLKIVD